MTRFNRIFSVAFVGLMLAAPVSAQALDLPSAKNAGKVGETPSGYIAPVGGGSPEVSALVADVNAKRKAEYQRISGENGQSVSVVEKLAAQKLYERLASGEYYQDAAGAWQKK